MVSVTKEQSSVAHFFKTKGGIPRELSVEFDLMRDKSGRISELEAGLNVEGLKRGASLFILGMLRLVGTKTSERMLFHS